MLQICLKGYKITWPLIIIWFFFFLFSEQKRDSFPFTLTQNCSHIINYRPESGYPSFFSIISILVFMRAAGVYVVEAVVRKCRVVTFPQGDVLITLRIGRNSTTSTYHQTEPTEVAQINSVLQLNVDNSALETQRCSLTLTSAQKKVIGIALVTLPKDRDSVENTYRLTQSDDKRAEIDLKIRIMPVQSASLIKGSEQAKNVQLSKTVQDNPSKDEGNATKIYSGVTKTEKILVSSINLRSRASEDFNPQNQQKRSKTYKIRQEDKQISIKQSELKQLKEQRQAYYQLYQIQKSKNEIASKFIASLIRKLQHKFPNVQPVVPNGIKRMGQNNSNGRIKTLQSQQTNAAVQQLEQANRSLHRQVEQYKKISDQLRAEVARLSSGKPTPSNESNLSKQKNSFNPWDLYPKKSNILPAELTNQTHLDGQPPHQQHNQHHNQQQQQQQEKKPSFSDVDLKKWLQQSVGQRQHFQQMLASLNSRDTAATVPDKSTANVRKMKVSIDRAYTTLLGRKELTRQAILLHKQDINRILDEMIAA